MGYQTLSNSVVKTICKKIFNQSYSSDLHAVQPDKQQNILNEFIAYFADVKNIQFQPLSTVIIRTHLFQKKGLESIGSLDFELQAYSKQEVFIGFQTNQLRIIIKNEVYSLHDYQQIITLHEKLKIEAEKADLKYHTVRAEAEKKAKIKELKKQAIVAKAVALAKTEGLPYIISTHYATKIVFWVRLSDKTAMNVHIPYNDYQKVLQNTQATIQAIRKLVDEKMHISVFNSPSTSGFKWQIA
jgi:hypothetical protein